MQNFLKTFLVTAIVLTSYALGVCNSSCFSQDVTAEQVEKSIKSAIDFLKREQSQTGSWAGYENYASGQSALVVLAMLNCGVSPDDPTVERGLKYLNNVAPAHTYEASLHLMALCAANPKRYSATIRRDIAWLEAAQVKKGHTAGGWDYNATRSRSDTSNSQFAVLALWEAQRAMFPISLQTTDAARDYWIRWQWIPENPRGVPRSTYGGWTYPGDSMNEHIIGTMTCAGIASLAMTEDALLATRKKAPLQCCGKEDSNDALQLGLDWLDANVSGSFNTPDGSHLFYYLYALERVGRLTGYRYFNRHDWYREGCQTLLKHQVPGSGQFEGGGENDRITDTALALLFLSKGKRQIVFANLETGSSKNNAVHTTLSTKHRRAIQHLTGHIEQAWKRDLAWQSVSLADSSVADLLESPILFLNGKDELNFSAEEKQKLKSYIDQGGFLYAEANNGNGCNGEEFDRSFRALMEELFEKPLTKLPIDHPIWYAEAEVAIDKLPKDFWLYGLDACCRTSVVYSPITLACRWEALRPYGLSIPLSENDLAECEQATILGVNLATYATGRELKQKLDRVPVLDPSLHKFETTRGVTQVPRLGHSGGADDTPRSIPNLMAMYAKELQSRVSAESPIIAPESGALLTYSVAYLSGRRKFQWNDAEREAIRNYLVNGGIILGDAVCGSGEFTASVKSELSTIMPEARWRKVSPDHPLLSGEFEGFDIRKVTLLRPGNAGKSLQLQKVSTSPVLEMLVMDDLPLVVFSPYDLSCALESKQTSMCLGYPRTDAAKIAINMVLYAMLLDRETK